MAKERDDGHVYFVGGLVGFPGTISQDLERNSPPPLKRSNFNLRILPPF